MALAFLLELEFSHSLSRQRVFRDRLNPIDIYSDTEFIARYKITKCILVHLQEKVVTFLHRSTTRSHPIPATTQLAVALQFLATGWLLSNCNRNFTWDFTTFSLTMHLYSYRYTLLLR